jgi:hypothetical protein
MERADVAAARSSTSTRRGSAASACRRAGAGDEPPTRRTVTSTPVAIDAARDPEGVPQAIKEKTDAERRDAGSEKARDAELKRQADVEAAVAKANDDELPKLGGRS